MGHHNYDKGLFHVALYMLGPTVHVHLPIAMLQARTSTCMITLIGLLATRALH